MKETEAVTTIVRERFGTLLKRYRLAAGLTQEALAERAGLSARAVSDLERDPDRLPRLDSIALLGDALGLTTPQREMLRAAARPTAAVDTAPSQAEPVEIPLPTSLSSFIGRELELQEVAELLEHPRRLVTLTGPGGSGKTRLAVEVARHGTDRFPNGSRLVELAAVTDPALVPAAVAAVFGVVERPTEPLVQTLGRRLAPMRLLLVLDNCEHLVEACAGLCAELLGACPGLQVLATSREVLGLPGEHAWAVPPLAAPPEGADLATVAASEAVQLFMERARARGPSSGLTAENASDVGDICRRLDGLPLALELAAARTQVLAPAEILRRLDDRFALLTTPARGRAARQQSLLATVEWSYELLHEDEQRLFRRLSVCVGGFDLAAAEALDAPASATLDRLSRLIDKSLIARDERGHRAMRYRLLETLREFGRARLVEANEETGARERHFDRCLALAAEGGVEISGGDRSQLDALAALDADHDNLRAALEWGLTHEGAEVLRLAADLAPFWRWRGYRSEGRRWLTAALARAPADAAARGRALVGAAILAYDQGDGEALVAHASEAVEHCRRSGDAVGLGLALHRLALVPDADVVRREALVLEALALFESADFTCGIGEALSTLGNQAVACKDFARAEELHARALTAHRSVGNDRGAAAVLGFLGAVVEKRGDLSGARAFYEASLATGRPYGLHTQLSVMGALVRLADLAWFEGRGDEAHSMLREAVAEVRHMDSFSVGHAIHWTGVLHVRQGRSERGVSLMACAAAHWGSFGSPRDITGAGDVGSRYEASLAEARSALSPDRFTRAWAEGERMSVEQAAELILAEPSRSA